MEPGARLARALSHAATHPSHIGVLWSKVFAHVDGSYAKSTRAEGQAFARRHAALPLELAVSPAIWREAEDFAANLVERASVVLNSAQSHFGGGGFCALLYYLTRLAAPKTILETGVAAGWSSAAFLCALQRNGAGQLWSSDFPYLDRDNKAQDIGLLVQEELRGSWRLFADGDRINLPKIVTSCGPIDLFHYDSDKTYKGRAFAYELVRPQLSPNALVVFDDIQDNGHFADLVGAQKAPFLVFQSAGKYVGVTGAALGRYFHPPNDRPSFA